MFVFTLDDIVTYGLLAICVVILVVVLIGRLFVNAISNWFDRFMKRRKDDE